MNKLLSCFKARYYLIKEVPSFIEYRLFYPFIALLPLKLAYKMADLKAELASYVYKEKVAIYAQGVERCFATTSAENRAVIRGHMRMLAREKLDTYFISAMRRETIEQYIKLTDLDHYLAAKKTNRPVILYTAHVGRLVLPALALGLYGHETSTLTATVGGSASEVWYLRKKLSAMQSVMQGTFVQTNESMRLLYNVLARGETLIILVDVSPAQGQAYYEVDFLKGVARFPKGIIKLAKKLDALLVPYFAIEQQAGVNGLFLPAIETRDRQEDEILNLLLKPIEEKITQYPEHWWMWPYLPSFWKKR